MIQGGTGRINRQDKARNGNVLVSIITVVYNGVATLERTINSVLEQGYPHIEYIIVDGGSTDGTVDLLRRYDDRIHHWQSAPDKGIYDAMNKGLELCSGDLVGLINADDWYEPNAVGLMVEAAVAHPDKNIFHGDIWIHYPNGTKRVKKPKRPGFLLKYWEMVLNHPSFFVKRELYDERRFDTQLRVSSDHKWTLAAYLDSPDQFCYVEGPISNFSAGGASMSIPLAKVLQEGGKVSRDLGMNAMERALGHIVKIALYVPQVLKLLMNQYVRTGTRKGS